MQIDFQRHPFGLPASEPRWKEINKILKTSYLFQKQTRTSNACGVVSIVLKRVFDAIGVESAYVYGTMHLGGLKHPHVWLNINNFVIDNTFIEDAEDLLIQSKMDSKTRYENTLDGDLFLGDEFTESLHVNLHDVNTFRWIINHHNKALALFLNKHWLKSYFDKMTMFMLAEHGVSVQGISEKVRTTCWQCRKEDTAILTCSKCKVAKYCGKACQKKDWKLNHKSVCCHNDC